MGREIRHTTYRRGYRRNSLFARTAEADKVGDERRDRWTRCCWCAEDAFATPAAPHHQPWGGPLWPRPAGMHSGFSPQTDHRHFPKSHRPGWWRWTRWSFAMHHRARRRMKTKRRRRMRSRRHRGERGTLLIGLGWRCASPRRPSPTYPMTR